MMLLGSVLFLAQLWLMAMSGLNIVAGVAKYIVDGDDEVDLAKDHLMWGFFCGVLSLVVGIVAYGLVRAGM